MQWIKCIQVILDDSSHKKIVLTIVFFINRLFSTINIKKKKCIEISSIKQFLFSSHNYQFLIKVDISLCEYAPSITSSNRNRTSYAVIGICDATVTVHTGLLLYAMKQDYTMLCNRDTMSHTYNLAHHGTNDGGALRFDLLSAFVRTGACQSRIWGSLIMSSN